MIIKTLRARFLNVKAAKNEGASVFKEKPLDKDLRFELELSWSLTTVHTTDQPTVGLSSWCNVLEALHLKLCLYIKLTFLLY